MNTPSNTEAKSSTRRRLLSILALLVLTILGLLGLRWTLHGRFHVETDDASVAGDIVAVTPQVAGTVSKILVEDTLVVHAGDPLVILDATDLKLARERAEAELLRTLREVRALYAQTDSMVADAASARSLASFKSVASRMTSGSPA